MRKRKFNCNTALPSKMDIVVPRPFYVAVTYCYYLIIFFASVEDGSDITVQNAIVGSGSTTGPLGPRITISRIAVRWVSIGSKFPLMSFQ
jgi:hypothetical protein